MSALCKSRMDEGKSGKTGLQAAAGDVQGRKSFVSDVVDLCSQCAQGIHQDADGTLLHTLGAGDDACAGRHTEVSGEEAHGGSGSHDVDVLRMSVEGTNHDARVVAVAQVGGQCRAAREGVQDKGTVADAFRSRQLYGGVQAVGAGQ